MIISDDLELQNLRSIYKVELAPIRHWKTVILGGVRGIFCWCSLFSVCAIRLFVEGGKELDRLPKSLENLKELKTFVIGNICLLSHLMFALV